MEDKHALLKQLLMEKEKPVMENEEPVQLQEVPATPGPKAITVGSDEKTGTIVVSFGSSRMVMTVSAARDLALLLRQEANRIQKIGKFRDR